MLRHRFMPLLAFDGDDGGGRGSGDGAPPADPPKTFTQEQVNAFLAQDRRKTADELEALRPAAARLAELEAASLTETERLQRERDEATAERDAAKKAAEDAQAGAHKTLARAAFIVEATKAGAVDPDAAYALAANDGHTSSLTVSEDGTVTGVADAVKATLDARTFLVPAGGAGRPTRLDGGPRHTPNPGSAAEQAAAAEVAGDFKTAGQAKAQQIAASFDALG